MSRIWSASFFKTSSKRGRFHNSSTSGRTLNFTNTETSFPKAKTKACHQKELKSWIQPAVSRQDNENRVVLVIEYKSPHKLGLKTLKAGLEDLKAYDLICRAKTLRDQAAKQESSEDMVVSVIAQVYTYMIDSGIQYAYLTTGEAFVFLNLPDGDQKTLHYTLVIPKDAFTKSDNDVSRTAIGQILSFYILACRGHHFNQDERHYHRQCAQVWAIDNNKVVENMTPSPDRSNTPISKFKSNRKRDAPALSASPSARKLRPRESCLPLGTKDPQRDSGGDSGPPSPSHVSAPPQVSSTAKDTLSSSRKATGHTQDGSTNSSRNRHLDYCSHQCLLSLAKHGVLDPHCPNYTLHPRTTKEQGAERHTIDVEELGSLLHTQLLETMNTNVEPLGIQGARGAIFKLTLASHGYTMIGKGTPPWYVPDLEKERAVYSHLGEIQGNVVPVCLGAIHLQRQYFYHPNVPIFYWLLLSFAGRSLDWQEFETRGPDVKTLRRDLLRRGISHRDLSPNNVLWDEAAKKLMVVDFERAIMTGVRREVL